MRLSLENENRFFKKIEPLYDVNSTFWENLRKGPRALSLEETEKIKALKSQIEEIKEKNGVNLNVKLFGKNVESPIGLCSGPAYGYRWLNFYSDLGYDILTQKTVRDDHLEPYPLPNIVNIEGNWTDGFFVSDKFTGSITNSFGIGSLSPDYWFQDLKEMVRYLPENKAFKVSVIPHTKWKKQEEVVNAFIDLSRMVKKLGADGVELNLSCPNFTGSESSKGEIYQDAKYTRKIVEAVKDEINDFPLLIKVGYLKDYRSLLEEVSHMIYGIVAINAMPATIYKKDGSPLFVDRGNKGGVCGLALKEMALNAISQLVKIRKAMDEDFLILGVGGILYPEIALKYFDLGVDAIEIGTGAIYNPSLALEIKKSLLERKLNY